MREKLRDLFSIDLRALGLFRIALGFILFSDLVSRAFDLRAHYTDAGVLPLSPDFADFARWRLDLLSISGSPLFVGCLWTAGIVAALMLTSGFHTRLASVASWIFLVSVHNRNPFVNHSGDQLLRLLLFWSLFLPMGARYSIDEALNLSFVKPRLKYFSFAGAALLLQPVLMYTFVALHKTSIEWLHEGTATQLALSLTYMTRPMARVLLHFPRALVVMNFSVLAFQFAVPFLMFSPWRTAQTRLICIAGLFFMQMGFGTSLILGIFPFVAAASTVPFLPSSFLDWAGRALKRPKVKIYYDAECAFCRRGVYILREKLFLARHAAKPAQLNKAIFEKMNERSSWVVIDAKGTLHFGFEGFVTMVSSSPAFWPLAKFLSLAVVRVPGEKIYRFVADRRPLFSKLTRFLVLRSRPFRERRCFGILALICLISVVIWNTTGLLHIRPPRPFVNAMRFARLDQTWRMFSPKPSRDDGWFMLVGILADQSSVELTTKSDRISWDLPEDLPSRLGNVRWQKYMMDGLRRSGDLRPPFANYLCRQWDENHALREKKIKRVKIYFMERKTQLNPDDVTTEALLLSDSACYSTEGWTHPPSDFYDENGIPGLSTDSG